MASKETWFYYSTRGFIETDDEVKSMIEDVVDVIHSLEKMYSASGSALIVRAIMADYIALTGIADARGLRDYKRL